MSDHEHTPGPWERGGDRNQYIQTTGGRVLARVATVDDYPHNPADGDLISAAPELLEACEMAEALLALAGERGCRAFHEPAEHFEECEGCRCALVLDKARDAIAKAKGEA